ncbi:MAG: CHAT domain-containing protein [Moorea sp. SIO3I7]|uniref:CHAT domain-containing protein n=1 Tax=Moorena sp. SIO3I8 TaxID=2607833 RepID=UPI0013BF2B0A|nr:CHAT domain-containing protein [Moorena sp. SIO3I8]NEN95292.1 CHAT domain-containing protein [Moorena sp. SIO3I7]NEO04638.1 CHAT domain-containing protein [Moorena sp. SIO3I8]
MAQEFHISVTPLGKHDDYLVRIERVAPGVSLAEEQVSWPVEEWLTQAKQLMNDPLFSVLQGRAAGVDGSLAMPSWGEPYSQSSLNLVALGQELYNALFKGSLRDSWMMAQAIAQNQRSVLRLRLGLKGTELPRLPWEVLHAGDRPLATGTDVAFSRYQMTKGLIRPVPKPLSPPNQPLKILMVIAGPSDQESLELLQEASHLKEELRHLSPNGPPAIHLTILEQPGREQLTQALEQGKYQVFHYAGHSNLGESGGDVYLVSKKTGLTETVRGDDLAGLLVNNGVQLAVFNSCRGAHTAVSDSQENGNDQNLAQALVKRGIPGVLAMAERIPDEVALTLTRLLYRNINQGYPIDLSLSRARQGLISAYGSNQLYWALPVLYLHPEFDGFLTNDDQSYDRTQIFTLPDPHETSVGLDPEEAFFTPPTESDHTTFSEFEEESALVSRGEAEYDHESLTGVPQGLESHELEADDPAAFIKGLLDQLNTEAQGGESKIAASNLEGLSENPYSDTAQKNLPVHTPSQLPAPRKASAATLTAALSSDGSTQLAPKPEDTTAEVEAKKVTNPKQKGSRLPGSPLWIGLGATGTLALVLLGVWFFQKPPGSEVGTQLPPGSETPGDYPTLTNAKTNIVTAIAIEAFSKGNIIRGTEAVTALLDRGALPDASAALQEVPSEQLNQSMVSFLRGRLAWQSIQTRSDEYSLDDVRRYWQRAVKQEPDSWTYRNALGFAYYAEGKYERANQAWYDALYRSSNKKSTTVGSGKSTNSQKLNTYAGLALGSWKSAQEQNGSKRASLSQQSLKLRQHVLTNDPINFQPDALSKNWLWSQQAIKDWQSLLEVRTSNN